MRYLLVVPLLLVGCAASQPREVFHLDDGVKVIVMDKIQLRTTYYEITGEWKRPLGFWRAKTNTIYVVRDRYTGRAAEQELGHEMNHRLYGNWHKEKQ